MANGHGGKRAGAGKPKGTIQQVTIDKALVRERLRAIVDKHLEEMVSSQVEHAKGVTYMMLRQKDGTFTRATDAKQIDAACAVGGESFKLFTQSPNPQAFVALLDRTIDKPTEHQEITGKDGGPLVVCWED